MNSIIIHEVGPRDGLQVEKEIVPTQTKIEWIKELISSGIDIIQVGSFVNPKRVPQMADTDEIFRFFNLPENKNDKVILSGLVLNDKGFERGMECGVDMFCMGVSASNTHSKNNTGMSTEEALEKIINIAKSALSNNKKVQVSVQSAFGCGYEGKIPEEKVMNIVKKYLDAEIRNISLADTAGHAIPNQVENLFGKIKELDKDINLACHFHNTYGFGITNVYAAFKVGVVSFESSFAGLGGCPFTAIASGNVATEDLIHMFNKMGLRKDIDLDKVIEISKKASEFFKRELPGVIYKTGPIPEIIQQN